MSTTIRQVRRWALRAALVLGAWAGIMLAMPFVGPQGRLIAIVGDPHRAVLAVLRSGGKVMAVRGRVVLTSSDRPGYPITLYRAGAGLLIEGRIAQSCLGSLSWSGGSVGTELILAQREE